MRPVLVVLASALSAFATLAAAQTASDLPDIGNPAGAVITQSDEYRIGRMIVRGLRDQNQLIEDPEVNEYLQSIGTRIAAQATDNGQPFQFFAVRDPTINAFALPGGFIGVNLGLILTTANESQLASVLAHEIAHVTQRHIARTIRAQGRQSIASAAAILAAILIGAAAGGGGDVMQGAIAVAQGAAVQQQINFTRANESEADRVGIGFLASAGFDPLAMPAFFETMERRAGLAASQVPEILQSHPVTTARIAESRSRAAQFPRMRPQDSLSYALIRERLRVLSTPAGTDPQAYYVRQAHTDSIPELARSYGQATALIAAGRASEAVKILEPLSFKHDEIILLQIALGQAQMAAGLANDGLATFAAALALFPRNVPLTVRYAEALMDSGRAKDAHRILLDLFNNVPPTPPEIRQTALAASAAGDTGDAYFYMAEYHISSGDLPLAAQQLELALAAPNLTLVQRERFRARLDEIREVLLRDRANRHRNAQESSDGERGPSPQRASAEFSPARKRLPPD